MQTPSKDLAVDIKCNSLSTRKTFSNAGLLRILSLNKKSPIQSIIFTLDQNSDIPHRIEGDIDFNSNEESHHIVVTGVKNVKCIFSSEK